MISTWVGIAAMAALLFWLMGIGKRQDARAPEDDVETPIDHAALDEAERDVRDDPDAKAAGDAMIDDDDDWGPGCGHSPLPFVK
jgi:hypothetical protein